MRCPQCKGFMPFSFYDEIHERSVYQCDTVGVETQRTIGARTHLIRTLDHSDHFYVKVGIELLRVKPTRLGREASETVLKKKGWVFEKDDKGRRIVPTVWSTSPF